MLHSALPRAYLAPAAMGYALAPYFGVDEVAQHPFRYVQQQHQHHLDETYAAAQRLSEQRVLAWDTSSSLSEEHQHQQHHHQLLRRASTPCPLDLSLKPPPTPSTPPSAECEAIEVDDEEDRRSREEARSQHSSSESRFHTEEDVVVDDLDSQHSSSVHSYNHHYHHQHTTSPPAIYEQLQPKKIEPVIMGALTAQEAERLRIVQEMSLAGYQDQQKLLLASPTHLQSYHHLLQTPTHSQQHQQTQPQPPHHHHHHHLHAPMTPPSTPSPPQCGARRKDTSASPGGAADPPTTATTTPKTSGSEKPVRAKKKHARRLKFDEDTSSPVSGTVILGPDEAVVTGDIDPAFNIVEVTEEARAELAKIENRLGPYQCKLCRQLHDDAFQLAQHRCSRIAHVEYRCPECDKRFSCPANLASHRRWHKPRPSQTTNNANSAGSETTELSCAKCDAKFSKQAALRKHVTSQHPNEPNNNNSSSNNNNNNNSQPVEEVVVKQPPLQHQATAMELA